MKQLNEFKINDRKSIIKELVGGGIIFHGDGRTEYLDGQKAPTEKEINDKKAELKKRWEAEEYARKRIAEFPTIQECVHAILDNDLEELQKKRQAVKTKYPKE